MIHGLVSRGLLGSIEILVDIQKLGLRYIRRDGKSSRIGAMTTFDDILNNRSISADKSCGALIDAINLPPVQIRNMATVGGSICSSVPLFDVPIAFVTLDASARANSQRGTRVVPLSKLFTSYFETSLKAGELVTEVLLPKLPSKTASSLLKLDTNANDLAILNVGTRITLDKKSRCVESRIVVGGGVGPVPIRSPSAENKLQGKVLDEGVLTDAAEATLQDVDPISDFRGSAEYRRAMCKVMTKRALKKALRRLSGEI